MYVALTAKRLVIYLPISLTNTAVNIVGKSCITTALFSRIFLCELQYNWVPIYIMGVPKIHRKENPSKPWSFSISALLPLIHPMMTCGTIKWKIAMMESSCKKLTTTIAQLWKFQKLEREYAHNFQKWNFICCRNIPAKYH